MGEITLACYMGSHTVRAGALGSASLEVTPRVCTLATGDQTCAVRVHASWQSANPVSVCLWIVDRPAPDRCWEGVVQGSEELELSPAQDVSFELRDAHAVLATALLRVVRQTVRYRHKRREPWNVFD